jgi:H+/Cl- antiporter ClcA
MSVTAEAIPRRAARLRPPSLRQVRRMQLRARRAWRLVVIIAAAVAGGVLAVLFAKLCDMAGGVHLHWIRKAPLLSLLLPPIGLPLGVWLTLRFAPEAGGSGIPQVIAASETVRRGEGPDARVSLKTAAFKMAIAAAFLLCGLSIGREGPTVQIVAALVFAFTAHLRGGPNPRTLLIAGGAAGVAAAFNTPIAGVVFAVEELSKGFDRRANTVVILVVVAAGVAAYALAGNYAYFGEMQGPRALMSAWLTAPIMGVICGAAGGGFSRALASVIGPRHGAVGRWRVRRPIRFALICGVVTSLVALASHGISYGTGYAEASSLLEGHPVRGLTLALSKWASNLAVAATGAPGGIFSPSLATGAGIGAALAQVIPFAGGRDTIVLGMAGYLSGVVQAPLTSAIILMEMTRDPGLVGPLMLTSLIARMVSGRIMPEPIYHVLAHTWMRPAGRVQAPAD